MRVDIMKNQLSLNLRKKQKISFALYKVVRYFLIAVLLLCVGAQAMQGGYRYRVRGRAVDKHGQPVPHARIVVDAGMPTTWEDFSYFVEADKSGNFLFYEPEETTDPERTRLLYVTGPLPQNAYSIITPPFNRLPELQGDSFKGRRILIKQNEETDIGDVPIQISYGILNIHLQGPAGNPLIIDADAWKYLWLRIRNERGSVVTYGGLSISDIKKAVNISEGSVSVALPEGIWYVEVSPDEDKGPWLTSKRALIVRGGDSLQLVLRSDVESNK